MPGTFAKEHMDAAAGKKSAGNRFNEDDEDPLDDATDGLKTITCP